MFSFTRIQGLHTLPIFLFLRLKALYKSNHMSLKITFKKVPKLFKISLKLLLFLRKSLRVLYFI